MNHRLLVTNSKPEAEIPSISLYPYPLPIHQFWLMEAHISFADESQEKVIRHYLSISQTVTSDGECFHKQLRRS